MKTESQKGKVSLRPHHVYCCRFADFSFPERGKAYEDTKTRVEYLITDDAQAVELIEGPDMLCAVCQYYDGKGCSHPNGDEAAIKKWDSIILRGLGLISGQIVTMKEFKSLVNQKAPLRFCLDRCPYARENSCNPSKIREGFR